MLTSAAPPICAERPKAVAGECRLVAGPGRTRRSLLGGPPRTVGFRQEESQAARPAGDLVVIDAAKVYGPLWGTMAQSRTTHLSLVASTIHASYDPHLARVEPDDRLVALARTMQVRDPETETALKNGAIDWTRFGETCLGQALYRHRTVYQNASEALVWSHLELSYFRSMVSADAILELVVNAQPTGIDLLRAEILLTTPASFILPRNWQGSADWPERQASLEYIHVRAKYLGEYRDAMREYCGPAASKLVRAKRFGTFRAMETAAVIYLDPRLKIEWNQIHLCELDAEGFEGFGKEFDTALRQDLPEGADFSDAFADLGRMRTIPRWTLNDFVVEADLAVARL
jgi:hypothetical protein